MKALLKLAKYMLIIAIFFAHSALVNAQECNSKVIRDQMLRTESMSKVKTNDTTLGYRLEIGSKVKVFFQDQLIAEVNNGAAYLAYKQSTKESGKKVNYFLLITISSSYESHLFKDAQDIRQIEPKLQAPSYNYFHAVISDGDILFDFSQSGEKTMHLGILKNSKFCDGGEVPF